MNSRSPPDSASISSFLRRVGRLLRQRLPVFHRLGDQTLQLQALQPGAEHGQRLGRDVGARRQRRGGQHVPDELQALPLIRQRNADRGHAGRLHDALVQLDQVLHHQADRHIGPQEDGIAGPALQDDLCVAILHRQARHVARGGQRLGEVERHRQFLAVQHAQPQVVVEQVQHAVRVARQGARILRAVERVVARQRAAEVVLHGRVGEAESAAPVIADQEIAPGEEPLQEAPSGTNSRRPSFRSGCRSRTLPCSAKSAIVRE